MHKDEHEQSDDEIAMKVMINEASTLLSVVTTGKAPIKRFGSQATSECSVRPSFALLSLLYRTAKRWKEDRHGGTLLAPRKSLA